MWLLDVNLPRGLVATLGEFGVPAEHAGARGWDALTNGTLVEAAVNAGFFCVLTRDGLFSAILDCAGDASAVARPGVS